MSRRIPVSRSWGASARFWKIYRPAGEVGLNQFRTLLLAPGYSLRDVADVYMFAPGLTRELLAVVLKYKVTDRGTRFGVPLYFFAGAEDLWTSPEVVKTYLPKIEAPHKELVLFANVGHHAVEVSGDRFLQELNARVRPLAVPAAQDASQLDVLIRNGTVVDGTGALPCARMLEFGMG